MVLGKSLPFGGPLTSCFAGVSAKEAGDHFNVGRVGVGHGLAARLRLQRMPLEDGSRGLSGKRLKGHRD